MAMTDGEKLIVSRLLAAVERRHTAYTAPVYGKGFDGLDEAVAYRNRERAETDAELALAVSNAKALIA